jgi:hypothetical protein
VPDVAGESGAATFEGVGGAGDLAVVAWTHQSRRGPGTGNIVIIGQETTATGPMRVVAGPWFPRRPQR